jgi:hypothetical protein
MYCTEINESGVKEHVTNESPMTVSESGPVHLIKMDKYHAWIHKSQTQLTPNRRVLLVKLIATQPVKKLPTFYGIQVSLPQHAHPTPTHTYSFPTVQPHHKNVLLLSDF